MEGLIYLVVCLLGFSLSNENTGCLIPIKAELVKKHRQNFGLTWL